MEVFTADQIEMLEAKLESSNVKTRAQGSGRVSYVEGYHVINEANRIFGFDGWSTHLHDLRYVVEPSDGPNYRGSSGEGYLVAAVATMAVQIGEQQHVDVGYGEGIDYRNIGQAYESAVKEAVTDAEKRALRHWGNQFGLALYDKDQREVTHNGTPPRPPQVAPRAQAADPQAEPTPTKRQLERLFAIADSHGYDKEALRDTMLAAWSISSSSALTISQYNLLCETMEANKPLGGIVQGRLQDMEPF